MRQCLQAEAAVKRHPELAFMLGFMRRYDKSYAYAKQKIEAGEIGVPYMVKATGVDPEALAEGAIRFAKTSGGIFLDMAIHDIDLMRWFLGCEATEVYALGATFRHPGFREAEMMRPARPCTALKTAESASSMWDAPRLTATMWRRRSSEPKAASGFRLCRKRTWPCCSIPPGR